jgi:hypothetical protein
MCGAEPTAEEIAIVIVSDAITGDESSMKNAANRRIIFTPYK